MQANKHILLIIFGLEERPRLLVFLVNSCPFHLEWIPHYFCTFSCYLPIFVFKQHLFGEDVLSTWLLPIRQLFSIDGFVTCFLYSHSRDYFLVIAVNLESLKYFKKIYNVDIIGGLLFLEKKTMSLKMTQQEKPWILGGWASPGMGWSSQWIEYIFLREYIEQSERKGRWSAGF